MCNYYCKIYSGYIAKWLITLIILGRRVRLRNHWGPPKSHPVSWSFVLKHCFNNSNSLHIAQCMFCFVSSFSRSLKTWPFENSISHSDVLSTEYGDGLLLLCRIIGLLSWCMYRVQSHIFELTMWPVYYSNLQQLWNLTVIIHHSGSFEWKGWNLKKIETIKSYHLFSLLFSTVIQASFALSRPLLQRANSSVETEWDKKKN